MKPSLKQSSTNSLKLFVWEGVLSDWTSGMVCVLAHNEDEAWELMREKDDTACWVLQGEPEDRKLKKVRDFENGGGVIRPVIVEEPQAFTVWGGG